MEELQKVVKEQNEFSHKEDGYIHDFFWLCPPIQFKLPGGKRNEKAFEKILSATIFFGWHFGRNER